MSGFCQIYKTKETLTRVCSLEKKVFTMTVALVVILLLMMITMMIIMMITKTIVVVMMTMVTMNMMVVVMAKVIPYIHTVHAYPTNTSLNLQRNPTTSGISHG